MILKLSQLPPMKGPDDRDYRGKMPKRALFMAPDAALALNTLVAEYPHAVFTDIFRSATASLMARATKVGVQRPGFSAHNYGLAFDIDVGATCRKVSWKYVEMVEAFEKHGFFCHRRDLDPTAIESWHFNYLGVGTKYRDLADPHDHYTWGNPVEKVIQERYASQWALNAVEIQTALKKLGYYDGDLDGKLGPLSQAAIEAFQRAWTLLKTGRVDPKTARTLAYVTATQEVSQV